MARFEERFPPLVVFGSRLLGARSAGPQHGTDVAVFQVLHNALGALLDVPLGPMLPVDGAFGPAVAGAARTIQLRFGLTVDGIVGPSTYFALGHGVGAHTTYGGPPFGSRALRLGDSGGDVYVLQNRLAAYGIGVHLGQAPNGTFSEGTGRALEQFKADAEAAGDPGLGTAGEADGATVNALMLYTLAGGRAIFAGRHGLDVAWVQKMLRAAGCYDGSVDGMYSPGTVASVRAFQKQSGLVADGVVGPDTFVALGHVHSQPALVPTPPRF